jgi:hypothetical protein
MIEIQISNGEFNQIRKVRFEGINLMRLSIGYAEIEFLVYQYDSKGELLDSPDIAQGRSVISPISNENQVNPQTGITLPEGEQGSPEFDWWWAQAQVVPLPTIIQQAITLLDHQGRFDRP